MEIKGSGRELSWETAVTVSSKGADVFNVGWLGG